MPENQLIFNFTKQNQEKFIEQNFVFCDENQDVHNYLEIFFKQFDFDESKLQSLIIGGEECSGKTYLLNIFAKKNNAKFITSDFLQFQKNNFYILEDIEKTKDEDLFHLINAAFVAKSFLIMSAKNLNKFSLKDLKSRLQNILVINIKNPDIETVKMLLIRALANHQLKLDNDIIEFLVKNLKREYKSVFAIVKEIEKFSFENKKKISLADVRKLLVVKAA